MNSYSISNAPASFQVHDKSHTVSVSSITQKMTKGGQKTFFAHQKKMGESLSKTKKNPTKKTTMSKEAQQRQQCMGERQQKALRNIGS